MKLIKFFKFKFWKITILEHFACRKLCTLARAWIEQARRERVLPHLEIRTPCRVLKRDANLRICAKVPSSSHSAIFDPTLDTHGMALKKNIDWLPIPEVTPPKNIMDFRTIRIFYVQKRSNFFDFIGYMHIFWIFTIFFSSKFN